MSFSTKSVETASRRYLKKISSVNLVHTEEVNLVHLVKVNSVKNYSTNWKKDFSLNYARNNYFNHYMRKVPNGYPVSKNSDQPGLVELQLNVQ